jgi:hypothetical protein
MSRPRLHRPPRAAKEKDVTNLGSASRARFLAISLGSLALITIGCGGGGHTAPDAFTLDLFPNQPDMVPLPDVISTSDGQGHDGGVGNDGTPTGDSVVPTDNIVPPNDVPVQPDGPFATATHEAFPQVPNNGGKRLQNPKIVTVTFENYAHKDDVESWGDFVVGSQWITTVGADYGIGQGTHVAKVVIPASVYVPPNNLQDSAIQQFLLNQLEQSATNQVMVNGQPGAFPLPDDPNNSDYLYMIYYPQNVSINLQGAQSCQFFGGYHADTQDTNYHVAYAVLPDCGDMGPGFPAIDEIWIAASHELMEAATDAYQQDPAYDLMDDYNPWTFFPGEIGDLCAQEFTAESTFYLQRIWSNTAAAAGTDPCIPADNTKPYYNVSASPNQTQVLSAGQSVTYTLTGWSTQPIGDWYIQTVPGLSSFNPQVQLSSQTINNGKTVTMTVTVPNGTPSQSLASVMIISAVSQSDYTIWPVALYVCNSGDNC